MAQYEANTSIVRMEAVEKGKAPMRSAAKVAPPRVGTADRAKRPRPNVTSLEDLEEDLEKEALAHGSGDEEEDDDEATRHPRTPPIPPPPTPPRPAC